MEFYRTICADLSRLGPVTVGNFFRQMFLPRGNVFPYIFWLRVVAKLRQTKALKYTLHPIAYFMMRHYEFKYGIHANPNIYIGPGLHIVHGGCVFLNCENIGRDFTVYQGVTLGSGTRTDSLPWVEDSVTIYTGAVIYGHVRLHTGAIVGCNSVVARDVASNTTVVGAPAREIRRK